MTLLKWSKLSFESGASCLGASFVWGHLSWGELSLGRVICNSYKHCLVCIDEIIFAGTNRANFRIPFVYFLDFDLEYYIASDFFPCMSQYTNKLIISQD